jgi:hypothetical protein
VRCRQERKAANRRLRLILMMSFQNFQLGLGSRFHGLCPTDLVAFDEGANAQAAGVTLVSFLYSNRSCFPADIGLSGSRDFNRKSN